MLRPLILIKFHILSLWNWRTSYLGRFIEPVAYLVFLSTGLRPSLENKVDVYSEFVLAGLVCLLAFRSATASMSDVANDRKWGVLALYILQGGSVVGYVLSIVLFGALVFIAQFALLFACSLLIFPESAPDMWRVLTLLGVGVLFVAGWCGFGAALGGKVDSYATRDFVVTVTSLPVVFTAPLFYPIQGNWLAVLAGFNPLTYQVGVLRQMSSLGILCAGLWVVLGVVTAVMLLRKTEYLSRER
ncbi:ABC transporter permease [Rothia sp. P13129]|uniref:ABC transporter permease n=1 Tax=Rothia sp. P13129 TaxID=3402664 RepID=UPI003ACB21AB